MPKTPPRTPRPIATPDPSGRTLSGPSFAEGQPTPDPTVFRIPHPSDAQVYKTIDELTREHKIHPLPFPAPRGVPEPQLTLARVLGDDTATVAKIQAAGQIVFHALGDCGSTKGPATQNTVVDKLLGDFEGEAPAEIPQFHLLLGDVIYNFGEQQYYYDQFYDQYRDYPGPILACAGNHDGVLAPDATVATLAAFLRNFCASDFVVRSEAGNLSRTAQVQPGVFYTFEAPFVRIVAMYSNTLEDPGVISDPTIGDSQLVFLKAALERVKAEKYAGALLFATHHPPYAAGGRHGGSADMLAQMDAICTETGVWPHAYLSGHAHNYQRYTRHRSDGTQIPYVVCGNGGHGLQKFHRTGATVRAPQVMATTGGEQVVFENYDDQHFGYLRIVASATQLRIEYHPATDGVVAKTPDDSVTIDIAGRTLAHFVAPDLGMPALAARMRSSVATPTSNPTGATSPSAKAAAQGARSKPARKKTAR